MSTDETQREIIDEFSLLDGDREMSVMYLMELGQKLPALTDEHRTDVNLVKGCQSKVWLATTLKNGHVYFSADSNTAVTKGLVSLLIRIFNGHLPQEILGADLFFVKEIGMDRFVGTQRTNGFAAMIDRMKKEAEVLKSNAGVRA
ncbi:MAG: SufE family protein [Cyclobacteriaceae bacterium]|nr:SufE family protein [Cyclobacteriaceae bacterium]